MKRSMAMVAVAGLMVAASVQAETVKGDPAKAQNLVTTVCAGCHGADGNSAAPANPKLAGMPAEYIAKQLKEFKSGERKNATMNAMAAPLSTEDMANLGAFFAEKTPKAGSAKDAALAEEGRKLYKGGNAGSGVPACAACHGPSGKGIPAQFPRLGGQHSEYVVTQLKAFRAGERANDGAKMMRSIAQKMTDQEIKAVAEYVAGLH